jgi:hypothetical protein
MSTPSATVGLAVSTPPATPPVAVATLPAAPSLAPSPVPVGTVPAPAGLAPTPAPTAVMEAVQEGATQLRQELPALAQALAILLIGWALAVVLARATRRVLERAGFDARAAGALGLRADGQPRPVSRWLGQLVFYTVLLFTLAAFFEQAGIHFLSAPLQSATAQILALLPGVVTALLLATVAWLVAQGVGFLVQRSAAIARLDDRLGPGASDAPASDEASVAAGLVLGARALVYLVFLPLILGALGLSALTAPLQEAMASLAQLIPGLLAAGAILVATWFVARLAGQIARGLTQAMGLDRRAAGYGVRDVRLSSAVASVVSALVAVPGFVLAVNALGIPAIAAPINETVARIVAAVPAYVVTGTLLVIAWFVGRVASNVTATVLGGLGFDRIPERLGFRADSVPGDVALSELAGVLVHVTIVLAAAIAGARQLGLEGVARVLLNLGDLGLRALMGILIFLAGLYLSILTRQAVLRIAGPGRRPLALAAQGSVLVFALAVALTEVGVAQNIVTLTFLGLVVAVAGAVVLAIGLGGRDLAARLLDESYRQLRDSDAGPPAAERLEGPPPPAGV